MKLIWMLFLLLFATPAAAQMPAKTESVPKINANDLCKSRAGCKLLWSGDAGSTDKHRFIISEVVIPQTASPCNRPNDARHNEVIKNVLQEIWLTTTGGLLQEHKKLFELCNDGYGSAGAGRDQFTFGNGRITYRQSGGGVDRWVWSRSYKLPDREILSELVCNDRSDTSGGKIRMMDYETGAYTSGMSPDDETIDCGQDSIASAKPKYRAMDTKQIFSFLGIKLADIKTLGSCATTLTSREGPHQGYIIYGQQDDAVDVEVKYLRINDDKLWVDIRDTGREFKSSDNWVKDDRIEIWWLDQKMMGEKGDVSRKALRQFVVRLADLKVFAGYGYNAGQKLPQVERRIGTNDLGLHITWPVEQFPSSTGLTLSYAHGDGNATQVMWASSNFIYADPQSLSPIRNLQTEASDPAKACVIDKDGRINLVGR